MCALVATATFPKGWATTCACRATRPTCDATGTTGAGTIAWCRKTKTRRATCRVACQARTPHRNAHTALDAREGRWCRAMLADSRRLLYESSVAWQLSLPRLECPSRLLRAPSLCTPPTRRQALQQHPVRRACFASCAQQSSTRVVDTNVQRVVRPTGRAPRALAPKRLDVEWRKFFHVEVFETEHAHPRHEPALSVHVPHPRVA